MDTNNLQLSEIINNKGFKAIAEAIHKSTVTLLRKPNNARKYEVRYGVAQKLQSKSKSVADLAEYIGEFISLYNSETTMKADKGIYLRRNIREDEITDFYSLLDKFSTKSRLVGALLASYGFAKNTNEEDCKSEQDFDKQIDNLHFNE
jgi:pantoate kinase